MYTCGWPQKKLVTVLSPFPQSRLLQWSAGGYWNEQHYSLSGYWIHCLQTMSFPWHTLSQPKACHALPRNIARSGRGLQHVLDATKHVFSVRWLNITELKLFVSQLGNSERGKTGVTADRDKIEFRLLNSSSIFNITLREELFSLPKQNQPCCLILVSWR